MATPTLLTTRGAATDHTAVIQPVLDALGPNHRRQEPAAEARRRLPARARAPVDRGSARRRQDHARPRARARARTLVPTHSVHERPVAGRRARRIGVPSRHGPLRVPQGPDLRAARARRRDQPCDSEGAERAARGNGRAAGDGRRHDLHLARAILRGRDAQSRSPDRYVPAARVAARPLPDADRARLSRAEATSASCSRAASAARWPISFRPSCRSMRCCACRSRCRRCTFRSRCSTTCRR